MMKNNCILFLLCAVLCSGCTAVAEEEPQRIKVGVFDGFGGAQTCIWEAIAAIRLDPEMDVRVITVADISSNVLDSLDAIIIPGGGGKRQYMNLGAQNLKRITDFVASGNGAVGICAGAYLFSSTPNYNCMWLNGQQAIDIEHDNRGHGLAKFTLTEQGKEIFPELSGKDTCYVIYYEGPVFVENASNNISDSVLAIMQSDVHEEGGAPSNTTNNKPFFVANEFGNGRVFSSIAHPEATAGMMWLIPRMVRWTLNKPLISYKHEVVQPNLFNAELLMSIENLKQESSYFDVLLNGTSAEKLSALDWLESHHSWEAKRWVQGLLYDQSADVRIRAAQYIANSHYLHYLPDVRSSYKAEIDPMVKERLKTQLNRLEALLPQ